MNMESEIVVKSFGVDFDAIIKLCEGFDAYFEKHPEEREHFPQCNDPRGYRRKEIKSREMFIGKRTENFSKLLQIMNIEVDTAFLEAEYYLTAPDEGEIYEYKNDIYSIAFDFYIDPTAQIETCKIQLTFPKNAEEEIVNIIRELQKDSVYVVKRIYDGDLKSFKAETEKSDLHLYQLFKKTNNNIFKRVYHKIFVKRKDNL